MLQKNSLSTCIIRSLVHVYCINSLYLHAGGRLRVMSLFGFPFMVSFMTTPTTDASLTGTLLLFGSCNSCKS